MSSLSMYDISIPIYIRLLRNLDAIIDKAVAHAEAKKIEHSALLTARLAPDMFHFTRQVQIATDMAKGCAARLAGVDIPKYEDNEQSFAELKARLAKTIAFLQGFTPEQLNGTEDKQIVLTLGKNTREFRGQDYVLVFTNLNVGFHCTTAYDILRHNGVEIGKRDYVGN